MTIDTTTAFPEPSGPPTQLVPPPGKTAEDQEAALKTAFPEVVKGSEFEVPPEIAEGYRYALMAEDYWKTQKQLYVNHMRALGGNSQTATVNGIPVATRRVFKRAGYEVPDTMVDAFWPANRK